MVHDAGNAWTHPRIDNKGAVDFWWAHAIISDESRDSMLHSCNFSDVGPLRGAGNHEPLLRARDEAVRLPPPTRPAPASCTHMRRPCGVMCVGCGQKSAGTAAA